MLANVTQQTTLIILNGLETICGGVRNNFCLKTNDEFHVLFSNRK